MFSFINFIPLQQLFLVRAKHLNEKMLDDIRVVSLKIYADVTI